MKVGIIKETDEYIVINKPAGMVVEPNSVYKDGTLVDWFRDKYKDDLERSGLIHRLDKDVSGVMVVARTQASFNNLKKQFQERKVDKEYMALVHKRMRQEDGEIRLPIARSGKGKLVAKSDEGSTGRSAMTTYEVVKKYINYTLIKVKILTGRTHQIRVHLSSIGHPVVGDKLYETHDIRLKKKGVDLGRLWLYAAKLGFKDLDGKKVKFEVAMPKELKLFVDKLK